MMSLELALRFYEIDVDLAAKQAAKRVARSIRAQLAPYDLHNHPIRFDGADLQAGGKDWFELHHRGVGLVLYDLGQTCLDLPEPVQQHLAKEFP